jgi:hypothetical protein
MNKKSKLLVYLQNNSLLTIDYKLDNSIVYSEFDNIRVHLLEHDNQKTTRIKLIVNNINSNESLIIQKIILDDIELNNMDMWSYFITLKDRQRLQTHGFIDQPGTYFINIHQNAIVHNYISYFRKCSRLDH